MRNTQLLTVAVTLTALLTTSVANAFPGSGSIRRGTNSAIRGTLPTVTRTGIPTTSALRHGLYWSQLHTNAGSIRLSLSGKYVQRPFTPTWYSAHPNAWHLTHPHADAWTVATWTAASRWVGVTSRPVAYTFREGEAAKADQATKLANSDIKTDESTEWLPVGVFAILREGQTDSNAMLQLSVSPEGALKGSYYDLLTDSGHSLKGSVNKQTQLVGFSIGESKGAVWETSLNSLTASQAQVTVYFNTGRSQKWALVRMEK